MEHLRVAQRAEAPISNHPHQIEAAFWTDAGAPSPIVSLCGDDPRHRRTVALSKRALSRTALCAAVAVVALDTLRLGFIIII